MNRMNDASLLTEENAALHARLRLYEELSKVWAEYVEFLDDALADAFSTTHFPEWGLPGEAVHNGQEFRDRIKSLQAAIDASIEVLRPPLTESIRDDGCTCPRTTYDEAFHELHQTGCPLVP